MNYEAIKQAMQAELDSPQRLYLPNSPGAFVRDRLFKEMNWEEATWFWGCYCQSKFGVQILDDMLPKLNNLNKNENMPAWGTQGT